MPPRRVSGGGDGGDPLREGAVVVRVGHRPRSRLGAGVPAVPAALVGIMQALNKLVKHIRISLFKISVLRVVICFFKRT